MQGKQFNLPQAIRRADVKDETLGLVIVPVPETVPGGWVVGESRGQLCCWLLERVK